MDTCRYKDTPIYRRQKLNIQRRCQCTNTRTSTTAAKQNKYNCQKKITILKFAPALPRQAPTLAGLWVLKNSDHTL